ncbi:MULTISPECIES: ammonia-dependent NAD(+) synthetase [Aerococcus]|uniref:NH(3)-dependent NAD(+) synthetase n=1 Tax=Aerococcus sanguinicola TaxID=119206 RepID=A0A5N1GIH1_9LACT|nr:MULTISPECIES: ammonia-dependent NAD(+) synthetase [Aerococcus]KAA9300562.1 ammonia-dependent NAD(+) synthetase [Aerococcus sanguinicola]MDK6369640.1 ammonia-dependent NAD(+) synthetase [Aerococcus sp. UMB9870]MDK6680145.1 ammonia-dependent NAD(+) synthetase [Aerococcus sp. UMB8608]MDK6686306.1 ammonia-dependent NAD(+) synthetase [Aerococcus sp. UMB8623]MDK6940226.1 ammonia-dependent NAD(+) synthetase [Aerococcus sp. UMB8487]
MRPLQAHIIDQLCVKASIDVDAEIRQSIDFIKDYFKQHPFFKTLVLGISGGQDSTLVGRLCQLAMEELREETGRQDLRFIAVRLPYGKQLDEDDAQKALKFIQADQVVTVNIKAAVDGQVEALEAAGVAITDFNKGNIKARQRMVSQFAIAGADSGIVAGSDHAAEAVTGFYTKFGDGAADIMPIWRLNKRQGAALLQALGAEPRLYEKVPTADLEDDKPGQADEEALGVSYQAIDDYLEGKDVPEADAERIEVLYQASQHKRELPVNVYDQWWR